MAHIDTCATRPWYPGTDCEGSPYLIRWGHDLLGDRWACLAHAIEAVRHVPDAILSDGPDDEFFLDEIRRRAQLVRAGA